jgi:DNA modification methylase
MGDGERLEKAVQRIKEIDWDFVNAKTNIYTHDYHPWPAKFIPQIPGTLINLFTDEGDTVLDPFCGCGTTLVEAKRFNRNSIGVDFHPLAYLIAKVKTTLIEPEYLNSRVKEFLANISADIMLLRKQKTLDEVLGKFIGIKTKIPDFPNREKWFHPQVLKELGVIKTYIDETNDKDLQDFYKVCFSSILKTVSSQTKDWSYIADNMLPQTLIERDVLRIFKRSLRKMVKGMAEYYEVCKGKDAWCKIYQEDTRNMFFLEDNSVDFVVTSPPYANAVDYTKIHRLTFYWFNWPIKEFKEQEIGARWKRGRRTAVQDYFTEMTDCLKEIFRVMKEGTYFCLVVGDSHKDFKHIPSSRKLSEIAQTEIGLMLREDVARNLSSQTMGQKRIPKEFILVFEKK